jgi:two-component system chemotaxis response regulator CheB
MPGPDVVVIGGSAGGLTALRGVLDSWGRVGNTVVFAVLHRSPQDSPLLEVLRSYTEIPVHEPDDSPWTCPVGGAVVAPAGYHLLIGNSRIPLPEEPTCVASYGTGSDVRAHLTVDAPITGSRPSIDVTFASVAMLVNSVTAVLLSCANDDGALGCEIVQAAGGRVVLQDPATCEAPAAVEAALSRLTPDHIGDPTEIGGWLSTMVGQVSPLD